MTGIRKRSTDPRVDQKKMSYNERARNYYGHEAQDLKTREELQRRGVKKSTPNMPSADYRHDSMAKTLRRKKK